MTLAQFFTFLRGRWKLALLIWLATVVLIVGGSLAMKPRYTATATVVVDNRADPIIGAQGGTNTAYMATQVDVATSERVVINAIKALHLDQDANWKAAWEKQTEGRGSFVSWLADQISENYTVRPARDSNALQLAYTGRDPKSTAALVNALMQSYISTTVELRVETAKQYSGFFDERAKQLRQALEDAQNKLSAYQRQNGLLSTEERYDVETARLSELTTQVVAMQAGAAEANGRLSASEGNGQRIPEVLQSTLISNLSAELALQESRFQEMRSRLGDNHPDVIRTRSGIAELRQRLQTATSNATQSLNVGSSVARVRLERAQAELAAQRAKVVSLKAKRDDAGVLQRDVENAQRAYDMALTKLSQTDTESQARQTNVSVLRTATEPAYPSAPRTRLNAAVAIVLGALFAIGAVVVREFGDRRLRSLDDIPLLLGQPLLMVLPRVSANAEKGSKAVKGRVLNGLPRPSAT